jgi:arylsulfatase A-like enzyme
MRTWLTVLFAAAALAAIVWALYPGARPPSIVLVSVDTLRADRLGCYGNDRWGRSPSPVADGLAAGGILFDNCTAPRGQTHPSIASMLTGKYPITHGLRENGQRPWPGHTSFVERLEAEGYETAGFVANMHAWSLTAPRRPEWWTRGFAAFGDGGVGGMLPAAGAGGEPRPPGYEHWLWDESVEKQALDWIDRSAPGGSRPYFLWVHFYDVHQPYSLQPGYTDFNPGYEGRLSPEPGEAGDPVAAAINAATLTDTPLPEDEHEQVMALYDSAVAGVDARIGRILNALRERGLLDNTWIIYTSDHGEELGDHNSYYYHGASIYESVLRIPLIVAGPECMAGVRSPALIQNVDIAPTILDLAGVAPADEVEGASLQPILAGKTTDLPREWAVAEWQDLIYSITDGRAKYIFNPRGACPIKPPWRYGKNAQMMRGFVYDFEELYDLVNDPMEQANLFSSRSADAERFKAALQEWLAAPQRQGGFDVHVELAPEERRLLESLGYTAPDPKRRDVRILRD